MGELLKVGIAQQVGRCLGLTDNMGASYHYPVDSLRSAEFTRQHGLTASLGNSHTDQFPVALTQHPFQHPPAGQYNYTLGSR